MPRFKALSTAKISWRPYGLIQSNSSLRSPGLPSPVNFEDSDGYYLPFDESSPFPPELPCTEEEPLQLPDFVPSTEPPKDSSKFKKELFRNQVPRTN